MFLLGGLDQVSAGLDRAVGDNLNFSEVHVVGDQYRGDQLEAGFLDNCAVNYYQGLTSLDAVALTNLDVEALAFEVHGVDTDVNQNL